MKKSFILAEKESRLPKPYNVLGMPVLLKVGGDDTAGQISVLYAEYKKDQGPPLHCHDVDETFFITEGEFLFQMGEERSVAKAGDTVFVPRMMTHAFHTLSEVGKMVFVVNPTGNVEKIFEKLSSYIEMPSVEEVVRAHEELGLKIMGPPLRDLIVS